MGLIFVSVNYRMLPQVGPAAQAGDVAQALARAQELAPSWGGNAQRLVVMGHSAGAHLAALLSSARELQTEHGVRPWLGTVLLDSAALDVVKIMKSRHARFYDQAFGGDSLYWKSASPIARLSAPAGQVLAVCSSLRRDSCDQTRSFAKQVSKHKGRATVLPEDLSHKSINHDLGLPGAYTNAVEEFFRSVGLLP